MWHVLFLSKNDFWDFRHIYDWMKKLQISQIVDVFFFFAD